jgi:hypothetical protein
LGGLEVSVVADVGVEGFEVLEHQSLFFVAILDY